MTVITITTETDTLVAISHDSYGMQFAEDVCDMLGLSPSQRAQLIQQQLAGSYYSLPAYLNQLVYDWIEGCDWMNNPFDQARGRPAPDREFFALWATLGTGTPVSPVKAQQLGDLIAWLATAPGNGNQPRSTPTPVMQF